MWESVLASSLRGGDVGRIVAAIGLAEHGGASAERLASARGELRRLADQLLQDAILTGELSALASAIEGVEDTGVSAVLLGDAQRELWRLAETLLTKTLCEGVVVDEVETAIAVAESTIPLADCFSRDQTLLARARQHLRLLRGETLQDWVEKDGGNSPRASSGASDIEIDVRSMGNSSEHSAKSGRVPRGRQPSRREATSWAEQPARPASRGTGSSPATSRGRSGSPYRVAPHVLGAPSLDHSLEAGNLQSHRGEPCAVKRSSRSGRSPRRTARGVLQEDCSVQ